MQVRSEAPSSRTRVRRHPERAAYEHGAIAAILDEALLAHLGLVQDGLPVVIPTMYVRDDDRLYIHGSKAARWVQLLTGGADVCLSVTLLDGLVLARSAFRHSMNYRSVVIYGRPKLIEDHDEQLRACALLVEHVVPGRAREARAPNQKELEATAIFSLSIVESSAKSRAGGPLDVEEDADIPTWAGVIPATLVFGSPIADALAQPKAEPSAEVAAYRRGGAREPS